MSKSKQEYNNENYTHSCDKKSEKFEMYIHPLTEIYTDLEFKAIIDFYVLQAPIKKDDKQNGINLKSLKDYDWKGNSELKRLESMLLKHSNLPSFYFIRSSSIHDTLNKMQLNNIGCIDHPRAVLQLQYKIDVLENEQVEFSNCETRMECLFRHIRNAICHSRTYIFDNGYILLEDSDEKKIVTAKILIKKETLLDWIKVIKKEID